jgi:hypothetical protein
MQNLFARADHLLSNVNYNIGTKDFSDICFLRHQKEKGILCVVKPIPTVLRKTQQNLLEFLPD